jgi:hypothetical protein
VNFCSSLRLTVYQEDTYVKLSSHQDDNPSAVPNGNASGAPSDNEQLTREDLKFSVKIFLRSLEPEILTHTIDTGLDLLRRERIDHRSS